MTKFELLSLMSAQIVAAEIVASEGVQNAGYESRDRMCSTAVRIAVEIFDQVNEFVPEDYVGEIRS